MANYSDITRRAQVYQYLKDRPGEWVDGTELANERVGGSEGLKRLRELRAELRDKGIGIIMRKHPDPDRDIFQYQMVMPPKDKISPRRPVQVDEQHRYTELPRGLSFGDASICGRCHSQTKRVRSLATGGHAMFRDPTEDSLCIGCNGWGIVPSVSTAG